MHIFLQNGQEVAKAVITFTSTMSLRCEFVRLRTTVYEFVTICMSLPCPGLVTPSYERRTMTLARCSCDSRCALLQQTRILLMLYSWFV